MGINICLKAIHILILLRDNVLNEQGGSSLKLASHFRLQTTEKFLSRAARERDNKMCNRSASLDCCCHRFCRSLLFVEVFRQQEFRGFLWKLNDGCIYIFTETLERVAVLKLRLFEKL